MEITGYVLLGIAVLAWIFMMLTELVNAFPEGVFGLIFIIGMGLLFIKVASDRIKNKEDNYYSRTVDK